MFISFPALEPDELSDLFETNHLQDADDGVRDWDQEDQDLDNMLEPPLRFPTPDQCAVPEQVEALHNTLLNGYTLPDPPDSPPISENLDSSQLLTLKHYTAWHRSNGTVKAYKLHAAVLQRATGETILSLYMARKLAASVTELAPTNVDICSNSCIAYTGVFAEMTSCPHVRDKKVCGAPRYKRASDGRNTSHPRAQMLTLPIMATIRAMYGDATSSELMRHRDKMLQQTLHLVASAAGHQKRTYSDFGDSDVHLFHHNELGLFTDSRDVALALSTDGAQLTMKKLSNTWLVIIMLFNLPPTIRYLTGSVIYAFATPGPNPPGNIESFAYPLFEEMAKASEGIWTWDAIDSSYFVLRAYIVMILGDMLGSAKLSGMAGHLAIYGDRFSMVKAARSNTAKGSKFLYYKMDATEPTNQYNPGRIVYELANIPYRTETEYWKIIAELNQAPTKGRRAAIVTQTGVSRMPLCAAGRAFLHPTYFPIDPFHLFYENCMTFIWDLWTLNSKPDEIFHIKPDMAATLGQLIANATTTLPPSFCGPIRDPHLKRNSQYKIYEWMALLHWYLIPLGIELQFDKAVLDNFAHFVEGVESAMTIADRSEAEINKMFSLFADFIDRFEKIYVGKDPSKISRCRLCIFQLIHIPQHIYWNGSIRVGSQATCERAIGEVGHKIRSRKAPFAHLANIIYEKELMKILLLRVPDLRQEIAPIIQPKRFLAKMKILKRERQSGTDFMIHFNALQRFIQDEDDAVEMDSLMRWGKLNLSGSGKAKLSSRLSELRNDPPARSSRYFEVTRLPRHAIPLI